MDAQEKGKIKFMSEHVAEFVDDAATAMKCSIELSDTLENLVLRAQV